MSARMITFIFVALVAGCTANRASKGWVTQARVGGRYADFVYADDEGVERLLRNQLGDFTILMFTRCDEDSHGPVSRALSGIVQENRRTSLVKVVGVDIHTFNEQCDHSKCHLVDRAEKMISVCDATGAIRRLYGVDRPNRVVLIGPDHRVIDSATSEELDAFRDRLRNRVRRLSTERAEKITQEYLAVE